MNRYRWRNLIAKNKSGFCASVLRSMLYICAVVYGVVIAVRNFCYDKGLLRSRCAGAVVISVGNITAGGTGKTPLVVFLARLLSSMNLPLAILTRGYKATAGATADEPAVLAKSCPDAKVIVNPDRVAGARKAVLEHNAKVIVMDDGFQHRRLKRNLDIVTIDATCPFGYERLLPAGLLREPTSAIRRADAVVITRTDLVSEADIDKIENRLKQIKPALAIARTVHKHTCAKGLKNRLISIEQIEKKNIFVFCGIANPDAFLAQFERNQLKIVGKKILDDHYCYNSRDITDICRQAEQLGAEIILTTQKDWVKTALLFGENGQIIPVYIELELEFTVGYDRIKALLDKTLAPYRQD